METRQSISSGYAKTFDTEQLRKNFLVESIFKSGELTMTYSHVDRIVFGGIMPAGSPIELKDELGTAFGVDYFLERRELGAINVGGNGVVTVDGTEHNVNAQEAIYIPKGSKKVAFASANASDPAKFYYNSAPAHKELTLKVITKDMAAPVTLGDEISSNKRTIYKYIVPDTLETCQLLMGMTLLEGNSLWNTMPAHTHERRMEVYFYFNMNAETNVFHFMGEADETRHLVVRNEQAVISPSWSLHSGVGTQPYTFIWGMVGENQTFTDMDHIAMTDLK